MKLNKGALIVFFLFVKQIHAQTQTVRDPGVRAGHVDSGQPLSSLNSSQAAFFANGQQRFQIIDSVSGTMTREPNGGLGPRYNSTSCVSCHSQPSAGGSSPKADVFPFVGPNPQVEAATHDGAQNTVPYFISLNGPVREVRFKYTLTPDNRLTTTQDGGVHDLFTITGRADAGRCSLSQPDFNKQRELQNISFRIPTPIFGAGLVESITDATILANQQSNAAIKRSVGISGTANRNGNDGTITRFGWKAQNKSLQIFSGEAYNVEMGVTSELFQTERASPGETLPNSCLLNQGVEDTTNFSALTSVEVPSDVVQFSTFMRFLDQPTPSSTLPGGANSIASGRNIFVNQLQCALCHTPSMTTAASAFAASLTANLFSDLLVHHMGSKLADGVTQGLAGADQFRSAPLWGLGQRIFFLHDGRTSNLIEAIEEHASPGSEANSVIDRFRGLSSNQKQDLLNFLRSL